MAIVYSFFGITLAVAPKFCWGPDSPFSYWTVMDDSGVWFGRGMGIWMTLITCSPWYAGIEKAALVRPYLLINIVYYPMFLQSSFYLDTTGPGVNAMFPINLWLTQLPIGAFFIILNFLALKESKVRSGKAMF